MRNPKFRNDDYYALEDAGDISLPPRRRAALTDICRSYVRDFGHEDRPDYQGVKVELRARLKNPLKAFGAHQNGLAARNAFLEAFMRLFGRPSIDATEVEALEAIKLALQIAKERHGTGKPQMMHRQLIQPLMAFYEAASGRGVASSERSYFMAFLLRVFDQMGLRPDTEPERGKQQEAIRQFIRRLMGKRKKSQRASLTECEPIRHDAADSN